mgnify:CR=1 FL=1|jgi:hypothetical protein
MAEETLLHEQDYAKVSVPVSGEDQFGDAAWQESRPRAVFVTQSRCAGLAQGTVVSGC